MGLLKGINWFQKITLGTKEFFVEKSDVPLKFKDKPVEKEESEDSKLLLLVFSFIPIFIFPIITYFKFKNFFNKRKSDKEKPIYLNNIHNGMNFYIGLFIMSNFFGIITLIGIQSWKVYLSLIALNFLSSIWNSKLSYSNIENYDLMEFRLENEDEEMDGIEAKILSMQNQNIELKNKKIEYDFLQEMQVEKNSASKIELEKDNQKSLKKLL